MVRRHRRALVTLELAQPVVVDPEVVGDLVKERLLDRLREMGRRPARPDERSLEERDLARRGRVVGAPARPRHALVQPVQPVGPDARELGGRRLVLDNDRDRAELIAERVRERLDRPLMTSSKRASRASCGGSTIVGREALELRPDVEVDGLARLRGDQLARGGDADGSLAYLHGSASHDERRIGKVVGRGRTKRPDDDVQVAEVRVEVEVQRIEGRFRSPGCATPSLPSWGCRCGPASIASRIMAKPGIGRIEVLVDVEAPGSISAPRSAAPALPTTTKSTAPSVRRARSAGCSAGPGCRRPDRLVRPVDVPRDRPDLGDRRPVKRAVDVGIAGVPVQHRHGADHPATGDGQHDVRPH